jgi:abequosyltransferase
MDESTPLLAVSVPTYRRPGLLHRCLSALASQCAEEEVPLFVFDDSCSDINRPVYQAVSSVLPGLVVVHNPTNLGIDLNIDQALSYPTAQYVWVIGEDDLVREGAVRRIVEALKALRPPYLFVNYQYISEDYARPLHRAVEGELHEHLSARAMFETHGWATGFLGANVVNRARWEVDGRQYLGTYFSHVGKIFSQLAPDETVALISDPVIYNRAEGLTSFSWVDKAFEVFAGYGQMLDRLQTERPVWRPHVRACLAGFKAKISISNAKSLLVLRALGVYDLDKYRQYMRDEGRPLVFALIAVIPQAPLRVLYRAFRSIKTTVPA